MAERTIAHALFIYTEDGVQRIAMHGDRVELGKDALAHGEKHGAFEPELTAAEKKAAADLAAVQAKAAADMAKEQEANVKAEAKALEDAEKAAALAKASGSA
jgi:hypothetical protein